MENSTRNLKALFSNTRTRLIIIFTFMILLITVIVAFFRLSHLGEGKTDATATLGGTPSISSVPGALNPTAQYVQLQTQANITQAQQAAHQGSSAIPTIVQMQEFGKGVEPIMAPGSVGFVSLTHEAEEGPQSLWYDNLKAAHCSVASMNQAMSQGAALPALRRACSCDDLKKVGYTLKELEPVCSCPDLKKAGFNAQQLKDTGYDALRLRRCGFSACQLKAAGFTAHELLDAGFTPDELRGAGFPEQDLTSAAGLPPGVSAQEVHEAGCNVQALIHLREEGVSAAAIRRMNGCSAAQLKAAGYSAKDLRNAGFTAAELAKAGFTPAQLRAAGYTARDLLNAGFTPQQLADAGFSPAEIQAAENELPPGVTPEDVKTAGCSPEALRRERLAGISAAQIKQYAGCSAKALKEAGFTNADLERAGFTPGQIAQADEGAQDEAIKAAGCNPDALRKLREQGVSAEKIKTLSGCSAAQLKAAGYTAADLAKAGFTPEQLLAAGYTPAELKGLVNNAAIQAAGCAPAQLAKLREEGVSAEKIRALNGCTASQLKAAGYTAGDLAKAGFTPAQLLAAGFTPDELRRAGLAPISNLAEGRTTNCSPSALRAAYLSGVSATTIRETLGCSASAMKAAGYSAAQLKDAGYTAAELKNAGFTAAQLKAAGFTAKQLKDAGFSAQQLKAAGFTAKQLKDAGFSAQQLKDAGFSPEQLRDAGFSPEELAAAGITLPNTTVATLPGITPGDKSISTLNAIPVPPHVATANLANMQQLQAIVNRQNTEMNNQRYHQAIQERTNAMMTAANQVLQDWRTTATQTYVAGNPPKAVATSTETTSTLISGHSSHHTTVSKSSLHIKAGAIMFAVLDTTVNTDQPSPVLATIVSGKLKGSKLIGSFTFPPNGDKLVMMFNTISVPGMSRTQSVNAFGIDPNTGRTALSSRVDHHYLTRYGSMFAASFIEGFGNAFQSANTTVTIGGTGGGDNITVQNGIGRSALENAVIGLATVGKSWGQVAQQNVNRPVTVEVYSGTGVGILFTQDVAIAD